MGKHKQATAAGSVAEPALEPDAQDALEAEPAPNAAETPPYVLTSLAESSARRFLSAGDSVRHAALTDVAVAAGALREALRRSLPLIDGSLGEVLDAFEKSL
ncbi:MAG: hypothetical protein KGL39_32220 [Patescibacteria group bacterium]|nr:hypothetical protein [Patescibacteria group bacterium]